MTREKINTVSLESLGLTRDDTGYVLVIHNDDITPIEYVVGVLTEVVGLPVFEAVNVTMHAHEKGSATAKHYDSESEANEVKKMIEATNDEFGYDLRVTVEEE